MENYQSRKDVPEKYKWDLTEYFKDDKDFNNTYNESTKMVKELSSFKGKLKDPKVLKEFITKHINTFVNIEDLYIYSYLINDQELGVSSSSERLNKVLLLSNEFDQNTAFFVPEILSFSSDEYNKLFENNDLNEYKTYLDLIFRDKDHVLNESESKIVSELLNSMNKYEEIASTLTNLEHNYGTINIDGKKEVIAVNNYRKLTKNKDEKIRKTVYKKFNSKLDEYGKVSASLLNAYVKMELSLANIHKFKSSWESHLFNYNIANEVFESLRTTTENNVSSFQKYLELKKEVLKLDTLHPYDLNLDMGSDNTKYSIEEAQDLILKSLEPLGSDYLAHFKRIFNEHYIDYCQYKGKVSGAYSCAPMNHTSRIMMSYNEDLDSVSTIAHEGGHNVHHQYVSEHNPIQYRDVTTLVAEVASLTNECLLSHYISQNAKTRSEKLHGLENILRVFTSNLFGAVREAKMEQDMYNYVSKGGVLTQEYMDKLSTKSLKKYYGKEVKLDKYSKNSWITRSHYYMNYYLYNYAICISVASNVASKIIDGDKNMLDNYIKFLSTGSDTWPYDVFKILGIDVKEKEVYENAIKYFDSLVQEYDKIYNSKEV